MEVGVDKLSVALAATVFLNLVPAQSQPEAQSLSFSSRNE
jgi:hypothetical protein